MKRIGVHQWPHLNKVVCKQTDVVFWRDHVHTVFAWIDSRRKNSGAEAKRKNMTTMRNRAREAPQSRGLPHPLGCTAAPKSRALRQAMPPPPIFSNGRDAWEPLNNSSARTTWRDSRKVH